MLRYLVTLLFVALLFSQTAPQPLQVSRQFNITSATQVFDNRSVQRQCNVFGYSSTGAGGWATQLEYADTAITGPWTAFPDGALSSSGGAVTIAGGFGYHNFVRINTTLGSTSSTLSCSQNYYQSSTGIGKYLIVTSDPTGTGCVITSSPALQYNGTIYTCVSGIYTILPSGGAVAPSTVDVLASSGTSPTAALVQAQFNNGTAGAHNRTFTSKNTDTRSPRDYCSVVNGIADNTGCLQAAIDANHGNGTVLDIPAGNYKVTTLRIYRGMHFRGGVGALNGDPGTSTNILGTAGMDTFIIDPSVGGIIENVTFDHINVSGGLNGFHATAAQGVTNLIVTFSSFFATGCPIKIDGFIERSFFTQDLFQGGTADFCMTNNGNSDFNYMDKTVFINDRFNGGNIGFSVDVARASGGNVLISPIFNSNRDFGIKILGNVYNWHIINPVFELVGAPATGAPASAFTSGTTSGANATTISVTSVATFAIGQPITIQAAAPNAIDFQTVITGITGTVFTVSPAIPLQVTATEVTNAVGKLIYFGPPSLGSGSAAFISIQSAYLTSSTGDNILYSLDASLCGQCNMNNVVNPGPPNRPIYDPYSGLTGTNYFGVRSGVFSTTSTLENVNPYTANTSVATWFPSNPGNDMLVPLIGSGSGGTGGPYGSFKVITKGPNRQPIFSCNGNTGTCQVGPFDDEGAAPNLVIGAAGVGSGVNTLQVFPGTCASITNQGNLCNPNGHLESQANSASILTIPFSVANLANNGASGIQMRTGIDHDVSITSGFVLAGAVDHSAISDFEARPITISTGASTGVNTERMRITPTGAVNVGGNVSPSALFSVGNASQFSVDANGNATAAFMGAIYFRGAFTSPGSSSTACTVGDFFMDGSYLYVCNTPNHLVRTPSPFVSF